MDDGWLTWVRAADLVGCGVSTIDWYSRTGRIRKRPKVGSRPSLDRSSVVEFAAWWHAREAERDRRRHERDEAAERVERHRARAQQLGIRPTRLPAPQDSRTWLTTLEAADHLGVSRVSVMRLVLDAGCRTERVGHRWWIDERDVISLAEQRARWVSFSGAAELVGCSEGAIKTAVSAGHIKQRAVHRSSPSLDRESVTQFAAQWAERQRRRDERQHRVAGPPDDGDVWLDSTTTGLMLGVSRSRVSQLAQAERLPSVARGGRWWFRRSHVEQAAAVRALSAVGDTAAVRGARTA